MRGGNMDNRHRLCLLVSFIVLTSSASARAQIDVEPGQRYLLLAAERTSTMQDELDEAAALGFRIVTGSPTSGDEIVIFLERVTTPPDTYQYQLLATSRTGTMQRELEEATMRLSSYSSEGRAAVPSATNTAYLPRR